MEAYIWVTGGVRTVQGIDYNKWRIIEAITSDQIEIKKSI
jgi:hypothetical protein